MGFIDFRFSGLDSGFKKRPDLMSFGVFTGFRLLEWALLDTICIKWMSKTLQIYTFKSTTFAVGSYIKCIYFMIYFIRLSLTTVCSVITVRNLTLVKHEYWNVSHLFITCMTHVQHIVDQSWNKHVSTRSQFPVPRYTRIIHSRLWWNVHLFHLTPPTNLCVRLYPR